MTDANERKGQCSFPEKEGTQRYLQKTDEIRYFCAHIVKLNNNLGIMGSSNQQIRVLNQHLMDRYHGGREWKISSQIVENKSNLISIGIPLKTPGDDPNEVQAI
ncbi:MAG: hypothetical protein LBR92_02335 [Puniceicoccales bacterium]|nr:hypothetical protein [Puniceicoccales bacterium]